MHSVVAFLMAVWQALARYIFWRRRYARYVLIIGGPGAGKGTVASLISPRLKLPHLNMGDLLRREIKNKTRLGLEVEALVKSGKLVEDHITMGLLRRELSKPQYVKGAILDGVPRTLEQVTLLERMLAFWGNKINCVVLLDVSRADILERLSLRFTCSKDGCGRTYHLKLNPPKQEACCDACGSALTQRDDDKPEVVEQRLETFGKTFAPLLSRFKSDRKLVTVQANNTMKPEKVAETALFKIEEVD